MDVKCGRLIKLSEILGSTKRNSGPESSNHNPTQYRRAARRASLAHHDASFVPRGRQHPIRRRRMSTSARIRLITGTCLILALVLFAPDSRAQFYVGAEGGWTSLPSQTIKVPGLFSSTLQFNS